MTNQEILDNLQNFLKGKAISAKAEIQSFEGLNVPFNKGYAYGQDYAIMEMQDFIRNLSESIKNN